MTPEDDCCELPVKVQEEDKKEKQERGASLAAAKVTDLDPVVPAVQKQAAVSPSKKNSEQERRVFSVDIMFSLLFFGKGSVKNLAKVVRGQSHVARRTAAWLNWQQQIQLGSPHVIDTGFVQSPSKFDLHFPNPFYGIFTRWIRERV